MASSPAGSAPDRLAPASRPAAQLSPSAAPADPTADRDPRSASALPLFPLTTRPTCCFPQEESLPERSPSRSHLSPECSQVECHSPLRSPREDSPSRENSSQS